MKNYFLILALLCLTAFWGCKKDEIVDKDKDKTEQTPGGNSGDTDKDDDGDETPDDGDDENGENEGDDENGDKEDNSDDPNEESSKIPENMESAFPDPNFRAYVLENFDTNGDGKVSEKEALAVTKIDVNGYDNYYNDKSKLIKSLDGIQYFTNLTSLDCEYNQLTTLDVSKNTALTDLRCNSNQLTTLDVSGCTALTRLDCYSNKLTALDVSGCTALIWLECQSNQLTSLDVSKNTELTVLYCSSNQLTALDVSKNTKLTYLSCSSNQLTTLDVSKNTKLIYLYCHSNQIEELDLSKTNLVNSEYNSDSTSAHPFRCAPMETLKKVYLKTGWSIKGVTEDWNRSSDYIPDHTEMVFVD